MALCWSCNPMCGKCTPPSMVGITCPECGAIAAFNYQMTSEPEPRACKKCGYDLTWRTVPVAAFCKRYQIECGNPCMQHKQDAPEDGDIGTCPSRTAPIPRPEGVDSDIRASQGTAIPRPEGA